MRKRAGGECTFVWEGTNTRTKISKQVMGGGKRKNKEGSSTEKGRVLDLRKGRSTAKGSERNSKMRRSSRRGKLREEARFHLRRSG